MEQLTETRDVSGRRGSDAVRRVTFPRQIEVVVATRHERWINKKHNRNHTCHFRVVGDADTAHAVVPGSRHLTGATGAMATEHDKREKKEKGKTLEFSLCAWAK